MAGYVRERKRFVGNRPNTSYQLTTNGRAALERHVAAMQSMLSPCSPENEK
ncbi:MAG: transcriptional regulator [Wenzhouxiangellaceae bacterium]